MKLIIDIDEDVRVAITRMGLLRISDEMQKKVDKAIQRGTPIPENATNGGVVEKIFGKDVYCNLIRMMYSSCCEELKEWWNNPYQKGGKTEC